MSDGIAPALAALAAAGGVDPAVFENPAAAAYFDDLAQAVAMLGDVPPADPDADPPFDPSWPDAGPADGGPS